MTNNAVTLQQYWRGGAIASSTAIVALLTLASAAMAAPLEDLQYDTQQEQVSFVLPDGVMPRSFLMAQPARIVIDIPDTQVGNLPPEQTFSTAVKRLEVTQVEPQLARVILEMSPQAVFARGQVNLQNVGDAAPGKDRWVAKLLLSKRPGSLSPAPLPKPGIAAKPAPAVELPPGMEAVVGSLPAPNLPTPPTAPIAAALPTVPEVVATAPTPLPKLDPGIAPASASPANPPSPILPPAPGSVPIARLPEMPAPSTASVPGLPPTPPLLGTVIERGSSPAALVTPTPVLRPDLRPAQPNPSRPISVPPLASLNGGVTRNSGASGASLMPTLPPAPPLLGATLPPAPATGATLMPPGIAAPTAIVPETPPLPSVSPRGEFVSALPGAIPSVPPAGAAIAVSPLSPQVGVLPFGAQLPGRSPAVTSMNLPGMATTAGAATAGTSAPGQAVVALDNLSTGGVMLSAGTTLSLRYDQPAAMKLNAGQRQQTILSLLSPIVDSRGRVIVAQGSVVLGEFATGSEGSQFTSQALSLPNRSLSLAAQSAVLPASKQVSNNKLLQNSGIGALAGALLGGLNGSVLGGAAAGAAVTYAISPKQTIVQPGQTFQVQLTQNFFAAP
ncbi:MAG: hypothetical protein RLZZ511_887 [Cyanobacteriota bacterium]